VTKKEREALAIIAAAATMYEFAQIELPRMEKDKAKNKATLIDWLGDSSTKTLPDGRIISVSRGAVPSATIERRAYTTETIYIQRPAPAIPIVAAQAGRRLATAK
jgi:hypothetical protein